jgi:hypothetical protein
LLASVPAGKLNQSPLDLGIPDSEKVGKTLAATTSRMSGIG